MEPKELSKAVWEALEKSLPEVVEAVVLEKFANFEEASAKSLEEVKSQLKEISLSKKSSDPVVKEAFAKTAVVSIVKEVMQKNVTTEKAFKETVSATIKTMNEWTPTEWAELVFDQFEKDVLKVINSYPVINSVKILPLAKWDKISLPKATNWVTTAYVAEAWTPAASDAVTAFVAIDIYKAVSLVDMTDEVLEDAMTIPDLYNLIVEFIWESQAAFLENEILNWTGTSAIEWVFVNADVNEITQGAWDTTSAAIDDTYLTQVITKAEMRFKRKSAQIKWTMSQYIFWVIRALKTTDGYPLYPEMRTATPTLMGYAVQISDKAPVQNAAADVAWATLLIFWDMKYFTLVRRKGLTLERGHYWNGWRDWIQSLKGTTRNGWKATFWEALTKLTAAAV